MTTTVRSVRVELEMGIASYVANARTAGHETDAAFSGIEARITATDRSISGLEKSTSTLSKTSTQARVSQSSLGSEIERTGRRSSSAGREIDKLSGRLRVMTDLALIGAPALTAMGAGAVGGIVALSAELGAAAGALGVTLLAVNGLGKGLKALDAYQLNPTTENLVKMQQELKKLGPAGEDFVRFLDSIEPNLKTLQNAAREGLLPGLQDGIENLMPLLPQVRKLIRGIATEMGDLASGAGSALAGDDFHAFFNYLHKDGIPILDNTAKTAGNLAEVVANLFVGFGGVSTDFSGGLLRFSQGLADATANLDSNAGFQQFVDYIETEGPHALETLESIGNAVLQIVEATAPLGGPVLTVLGKVADIFASIADSDLGTPIFAGLAAMALFNRSMLVGQKLSAMTFGGPGVTMVRGYTASLRQVITAQDRATMSAKELAAAEAQQNKTLSGLAGAGKGIALIAGLTLANSDYAKSAGVSNAATLALAGSMAGPEAAAIGGLVGFLLDLKGGYDDLNDSIAGLRGAEASGSVDDLTAKIASSKKQLADLKADASGTSLGEGIAKISLLPFGATTGGLIDLQDHVGDVTGKTKELNAEIGTAQEQLDNLRTHAATLVNPLAGVRAGMEQAAEAAQQQTTALEGAIKAMHDMREEALRSVNAELDYQQSIDDATKAVKKNGETHDKTTNKGRDNLRALYQLAGAWNSQSEVIKGNSKLLEAARDNFIDVAGTMGISASAARKLSRDLFDIPESRQTQISTPGMDDATSKARTLKQILDSLHSKDINIALHYQTIGNKPHAPLPGAQPGADGMTVPGPRYPYGDKVLIHAAPGEEIITNRHGEADRFRTDRAMGRIPGYADGGSVPTATSGPLSTPLFPGEGPQFYADAYKHNRPFAVAPKDKQWPYQTALTRALELAMEKWVDDWNIPFDPGSRLTDYDMRGFYKRRHPAKWTAGQHFPDTWKTPYDTRFSHESMYATADNPFYWRGDTLVDIRTGEVIGAADGATVPGARFPYRDRVTAFVAPGEEIVSNRHGGADMNRSELKAASRGAKLHLANGGTVEDLIANTHTRRQGGDGYQPFHVINEASGPLHETAKAADGTSKALKKLETAADKVKASYEKEKSKLDDLISQRDSAASSIAGSFLHDPFGNGVAGLDAQVQADTGDLDAMAAALATLVANGLDPRSALYQQLAASADVNTAQQLAQLSSSDLAGEATRFQHRSDEASALGLTVANQSGLQTAIEKSTAVTDRLDATLKDLRSEIRDMGDHVRKGAQDGTSGVGDQVFTAVKDGNESRSRRTAVMTRTGGHGG